MMTAKTITGTLYVHVVLACVQPLHSSKKSEGNVLNGVIFRQILYDIVPYARHFLPAKFSSQASV